MLLRAVVHLEHSSRVLEEKDFVLYHYNGRGLIAYNHRGRRSKEEIFMTSADVMKKIRELRKQLRLTTGRILLFVSMAIDDMIRVVSMHPEVWFCDVVAGTNKQNRDWFVMACRTPLRKTFPGNLTVIPSGHRWVYTCISKQAFLYLYGETVCSYNRMNLHDEDLCQYESFESTIATVPAFKNSSTFFCVFHGVWQKFAKLVFVNLPKKSSSSKELSESGK